MAYFEVTTSGMKKTPMPSNNGGPICPGCGAPMAQGSDYCYHCDSFIDPAGSKILRCGEVSDQRLQALLMRSDLAMEQLQNDPGTIKSRQTMLAGIIGMALGVLVALFGHTILGLLLIIGSVVGMVIITRKVTPPKPMELLEGGHLQNLIAHYVTPGVLAGLFDRVEFYDPKEHISDETVRESGLIYKEYNAIDGDQLIRGIYHGIPVEMSNLHLELLTRDGDDNVQHTDAFKGIWMTCRFGTRVQAEIHIVERSFGLRAKHNIATENEAFNKRFLVLCPDEAEAFRFLTPHVMEQILKVDDMVGGKTYLCVKTDGRIFLAMDSGRSILSNVSGNEPIPQLRAKMNSELMYPLTLIDVMNSAHLNG